MNNEKDTKNAINLLDPFVVDDEKIKRYEVLLITAQDLIDSDPTGRLAEIAKAFDAKLKEKNT
ncbi:MAG: hypothetical protein AMK69_20300 [Nitrospira bacterium SG8_3]|nr:MAG: hypothetical protein AMK69_20300 [Nitrospira bacterium SG8_3]